MGKKHSTTVPVVWRVNKSTVASHWYLTAKTMRKLNNRHWPHQFRVERKYDDIDENIVRWCYSNFKSANWRQVTLTWDTDIFLFKLQQDATLFVLRWL